MKGRLSENPLAELIREIATTDMSGVLRLQREPAKVAIYFEGGNLGFAASNLRAHRLRECLKRSGLASAPVDEFPESPDDELAKALIEGGRVTSEILFRVRSQQVSDILRTALLWTSGVWEFDPRVRLAQDVRAHVHVKRLLLECARHLPADFVGSRFRETNGVTYLNASNGEKMRLLPNESMVLSRAMTTVGLSGLTAQKNTNDADELRAVYALSLCGLLERSEWPLVFDPQQSKSRRKAEMFRGDPAHDEEPVDVEALFARLQDAKNHYDVLDVPRFADGDQIKRAYHLLARRYHPDRFHQSDPKLRARVDSAFARIAQAYETLVEGSLRATYDAKLKPKSEARSAQQHAGPAARPEPKTGPSPSAVSSESERAESSFRQGLAALEQGPRETAIRLLAQAAMLAPRNGRYRAQYGHALIGTVNARRVAESEIQAAISLEPKNASHRVMLAELYETLGLFRRARGELERALTIDPKNESAKRLLASMKKKS